MRFSIVDLAQLVVYIVLSADMCRVYIYISISPFPNRQKRLYNKPREAKGSQEEIQTRIV